MKYTYLQLKYLLSHERDKKYKYPFTKEQYQENHDRYLYIHNLEIIICRLIIKEKKKVAERLWVEDQDKYKFFPITLTWETNINGMYEICAIKYKKMTKKEIFKKNEEFFSSEIWLSYKKEKQDKKEAKKETIRLEKLSHNKSVDGHSCKERRAIKRVQRRKELEAKGLKYISDTYFYLTEEMIDNYIEKRNKQNESNSNMVKV